MKIELNHLKCKKCQHIWLPRVDNVAVCPKCHSYKWKEEKKEKDDN